MADAIVINKADGENKKNAKIVKVEFNRALHLYPLKESNWQPKVLTASALRNIGIDKIDRMINEYISLTKENAYFKQKRNKQNKYWLLSTIEEQLKANFPIVPNYFITTVYTKHYPKNSKMSPVRIATTP